MYPALRIQRLLATPWLVLRLAVIAALALYGMADAGRAAGSAGLTQMVICGEGAARTVWIDAEGIPQDEPEAGRACVKCPASATALPVAGATLLSPPGWRFGGALISGRSLPAAVRVDLPPARAPPAAPRNPWPVFVSPDPDQPSRGQGPDFGGLSIREAAP